MIKLWNQEDAAWRLELQSGGEDALSLRMGENPRQLLVALGNDVTPELLRRAAAKAVKTAREYGAETAVLEAPGPLSREQLAAVGRTGKPPWRRPPCWRRPSALPGIWSTVPPTSSPPWIWPRR